MPYGKLKCDTLVYEDSGADAEITLHAIANAAADKIYEGDTSVEAVDTGTDGNIQIKIDNNLKFDFTDEVTNAQGILKIYGGTAAGAGGNITLGSGTGGTADITFLNPKTGSGNETYSLPTAYPASNGYSLRSETNGTMSWVDPSVGTTASAGDNSTTLATTAFVTSAVLNESTNYEIATSGSTLVVNKKYVTDTTSAAFSVPLPASPPTGQYVVLADQTGQWATNNLTVGRNSKNISGQAADLVCNVANAHVTLVWSGNATTGWLVK